MDLFCAEVDSCCGKGFDGLQISANFFNHFWHFLVVAEK